MSTSTTAAAHGEQRHPKGLGILFFAEMWERFSFYGMRGLLTLYLVKVVFEDLANKDQVAAHVYGAYGALVYATPFLGGVVADRLIGFKRSVLLGGILMAIGHGVMALQNEVGGEWLLYVALAFLIAGNGFFKPNISSMVGGLYSENDPRRDRGFTIFYMGINLGAGLQVVPAFLGEHYSWSLGFGLAGIGMLVGLLVFFRGQRVLGTIGDPPDPARLTRPLLGPITVEWAVYVGAVASVALYAFLVQSHAIMTILLPTIAGLGFLVVFVYALRSEKVVRERLFVVLVLTFFNIIFWTFFEQAGSSISLFTDRNVDRNVFGTHLGAAVFQSVNPAFILLLAPVFTTLWKRLDMHGLEPSIPAKFAVGLMLLGLGFLVMVWGTAFVYPSQIRVPDGHGNQTLVWAATVPLVVLLGGYLFHTMGELCLSPIGLSMVTKLSPKPIVAMVMGLWFLSTSLSHHVAGLIAAATGVGGPEDETLPPGALAVRAGLITDAERYSEPLRASFDQLARYVEVFWPIGWVAIASGVLLLALTPFIKKWQHGVS